MASSRTISRASCAASTARDMGSQLGSALLEGELKKEGNRKARGLLVPSDDGGSDRSQLSSHCDSSLAEERRRAGSFFRHLATRSPQAVGTCELYFRTGLASSNCTRRAAS